MVIQGHGSEIATSQEMVVNWKILVNQWGSEHSFHDELSHHLVFTKNDDVCIASPGSIMWAPVQIMWAGGLGQNQ